MKIIDYEVECENEMVSVALEKILTGNVDFFNKIFEINEHSIGSGMVLLGLLNFYLIVGETDQK